MLWIQYSTQTMHKSYNEDITEAVLQRYQKKKKKKKYYHA